MPIGNCAATLDDNRPSLVALDMLGERYPHTIASRNNLAGAYQAAGRADEAAASLAALPTGRGGLARSGATPVPRRVPGPAFGQRHHPAPHR